MGGADQAPGQEVRDVRDAGVPSAAAGVPNLAGPAHAVASASGAAGAVDQAEGTDFPPLNADHDELLTWLRMQYGRRSRLRAVRRAMGHRR